jgi:hypothetical protein
MSDMRNSISVLVSFSTVDSGLSARQSTLDSASCLVTTRIVYNNNNNDDNNNNNNLLT